VALINCTTNTLKNLG